MFTCLLIYMFTRYTYTCLLVYLFTCFLGLDVKGCNLVIRLGGTPSLIRLVQSKGRARDEQGEMRLILTTEEEEHLNRLLNQEIMLDRVMEEFSALTL